MVDELAEWKARRLPIGRRLGTLGLVALFGGVLLQFFAGDQSNLFYVGLGLSVSGLVLLLVGYLYMR